jgi:hypothetical protein
MMNLSILNLNLIHKASRDGFKASDFHSRCDGKGATVSVIKSEYGKTFGGFTNLSWNSSTGWIPGEGNPLFSSWTTTTNTTASKNNMK